MFDIGWQELFVIAALALIIIGPKDLPRTMRTAAGYVRKARGMAREFRSGVEDMIREAELDDVKEQIKEHVDRIGSPDSLGDDIASDLDLDDVEYGTFDPDAKPLPAPDQPAAEGEATSAPAEATAETAAVEKNEDLPPAEGKKQPEDGAAGGAERKSDG